MADFVMDQYAQNGVDVNALLENQKAKILDRLEEGETLTEGELLDRAYEELISDSLADMLTDGSVVQFLAELKQKDEGLWNAIKNAIKDLLRRWARIINVYEGRELESAEARALASIEGARETLQQMFAEAFAEANEVESAKGENKKASQSEGKMQRRNDQYSEYDKPITLEDVKALRSIISAHNGERVSINDFTSEDIQKAQKWAYKFYKELGVKSPFFRAWFGDWRVSDDKTKVHFVDIKKDNRGSVVNDYTGWDIQTSKKVHKETSHHSGSPEVTAVKYLPYIDDITKKAVLFDSIISDKDNENSLMFHTMYAYTEALGYPALLKIKVEELFYHNRETSGILKRDYILQNIEEESISKRNRFSRPNHSETNSSNMSISDLFALVKQYDKDFKPKAVHESMIENGKPKIFYHGTNAEFTEFDPAKARYGLYGKGFYFTDSESNARVALELPQILNNSIEVNRSKRGNNRDVPYTHVLIGTVAIENDNGVFEYYAVRSMVQERVNQNPILVESNVIGKLTSVNAKKNRLAYCSGR